ncbi:glycosyltransferase family 4 protein [Paenibacillus sp. NPDC058174]|uniref:glycosyltransferase family 4 protein n=1 Tax=Paenibacillus sp. NPDC058174 TaxID=3346366 RepID=UPI0036DBD2B1
MRILHLANHVEEIGNGIVNVMVDLACEQSKMGHDVSVASGGGSYETLLHSYGVSHYVLDQSRKPSSMLQAFFRFRTLVRKVKPDVIHAHMMTGALLSRLLKGMNRYKLVTHVHNEFQKHADLMRVGDSVIAVSQAVSESMAGRGIRHDKLRVILNGTVGSPRKHAAAKRELKGKAIVTVAGMYARKGIADLIEAFDLIAREVEDAHLYIVGNGPDRSQFEQLAACSEYRDRIRFEGFQRDPYSYMTAADVFVLASHREPFGLVLIEAREAGCAIVATSVDGIPEALDNGEAGMLVPPRNPRLLAEAVIGLLAYPERQLEYRRRAGEGLWAYDVKRVADETMKVYAEVLVK